ncbi:uncharacterized protein LOC113140427 [Mastacembelus armatus]|uniref:Uncharacterized LOC113140427 n=1 Tax=Mastacembelus armatus TaxID=205130 RepID=A0A3Q3LIX6_9TELE|nr:uncharacterized protein LOC113140427 [Mastacembelus armatus]
MNGPVYISFFQGQLESVLEQVVQLAVQEISKTVGSSLNALLLETATKEQENQRLMLQLQSQENQGRASANPSDGAGSPVAGKNKTGKAAGDERADSGRTKPEQHAPGGQGSQPGFITDTRRLEQRGRVVDQLKSVMEQVLDFAVRELTKIVEASFDDLLLEITKMEREQQVLEERLGKNADRRGGGVGGGAEKGRGAEGRRRGSENDSVSPSGSEDAREELTEVTVCKEKTETDDLERPPIISVSQDWVPILDKVFGQRWCRDAWQTKELTEGGGGEREGVSGQALVERGVKEPIEPLPAASINLEPSPSSLQQDPRWTPLEDMEVLSPDDEDNTAKSQRNTVGATNTSNAHTPGPPPSPIGSSGCCSSASMLHRLLTLPTQLLEEDEEGTAAKDTLATLATNGAKDRQDDVKTPSQTCLSPLTTREEEAEEEDEEEEEDNKGRKKKRRRVWSECEECGRRFSRISLLKAHRQIHITENTIAGTPPSSSLSGSTTAALCCLECGKRFSSATRLHSHIQAQHPGIWS